MARMPLPLRGQGFSKALPTALERGSTLRLRASVESWVERFIPRRHAVVGDYRLTQKNIYVLPSRAGVLYGLVLVVMLIASINYQLSLGYALTFLLSSVAVVAMMHTFRNLSQLQFRPGRADPVFAGQLADWSFTLINQTKSERFAVQLEVPGSSKVLILDAQAQSEQIANIAVACPQRGHMPLPRFSLQTRFPIGLWRAWSYWRPLTHCLVYPQPESGSVNLPASRDQSGKGEGRGGQQEDISALRPYVQGDHPRLIAWKAVARMGSDELLSKQIEGGEAGELLLDWWQITGGLDTEQKLSRMTRWVLDAEKSGLNYGLKIPGESIAPSHGVAHQAQCLEALALYETR